MTETKPQARVLVELAHESFTSNQLLRRRQDAAVKRLCQRQLEKDTRAVNARLSELTTNRYHDSVPLDDVNKALAASGFSELESMLLCGREGRLHEPVSRNRWLALTWYKMESGRYEVVAYVS